MDKKIFFFDIDGTLAIHGKIPQSNLEALRLLKEKGHLTFICTGRAPFYAQHLFSNLVSGYVCCNGRYILYQGHKLHGEVLSDEEITFYMNTFDQLGIGALFVSDEQSYAYHLNDQQLERVVCEYGKERIRPFIHNQKYYTFDLFYTYQYTQMVETLKETLIINDHGGKGDCDCSTLSYDKGHGILYLLEHFHITKENAYAFGDGYNDQAMFREVNHAIAMGNAVDVLKEKATYITDRIENEGIIKALHHYHIL